VALSHICTVLNALLAVVLSERIFEKAKKVSLSSNEVSLSVLMPNKCEIRSEIYGASDHCPVVMELEGVL
jgi:AP endonuclease-1